MVLWSRFYHNRLVSGEIRLCTRRRYHSQWCCSERESGNRCREQSCSQYGTFSRHLKTLILSSILLCVWWRKPSLQQAKEKLRVGRLWITVAESDGSGKSISLRWLTRARLGREISQFGLRIYTSHLFLRQASTDADLLTSTMNWW